MAKAAYVWDGTQFVSMNVPVGAVPNAVLFYEEFAPSNPQLGQMWLDTSTNILKIYSGSEWIIVSTGGSGGGGEETFNPFFLISV
jgi:hypothetical protein